MTLRIALLCALGLGAFAALPARAEQYAVSGGVFHVTPVRPVAELLPEALAASPPAESGEFRPADLVELVALDPTIRLDIRYASTRNFLGTSLYSQARAFMQRPAAEALVRDFLRPGAPPGPSWRCRYCGEASEAQFTACWSCGRDR